MKIGSDNIVLPNIFKVVYAIAMGTISGIYLSVVTKRNQAIFYMARDLSVITNLDDNSNNSKTIDLLKTLAREEGMILLPTCDNQWSNSHCRKSHQSITKKRYRKRIRRSTAKPDQPLDAHKLELKPIKKRSTFSNQKTGVPTGRRSAPLFCQMVNEQYGDGFKWSIHDLFENRQFGFRPNRVVSSQGGSRAFEDAMAHDNIIPRPWDPECTSLDYGSPRYNTPEKDCKLCKSDKVRTSEMKSGIPGVNVWPIPADWKGINDSRERQFKNSTLSKLHSNELVSQLNLEDRSQPRVSPLTAKFIRVLGGRIPSWLEQPTNRTSREGKTNRENLKNTTRTKTNVNAQQITPNKTELKSDCHTQRKEWYHWTREPITPTMLCDKIDRLKFEQRSPRCLTSMSAPGIIDKVLPLGEHNLEPKVSGTIGNKTPRPKDTSHWMRLCRSLPRGPIFNRNSERFSSYDYGSRLDPDTDNSTSSQGNSMKGSVQYLVDEVNIVEKWEASRVKVQCARITKVLMGDINPSCKVSRCDELHSAVKSNTDLFYFPQCFEHQVSQKLTSALPNHLSNVRNTAVRANRIEDLLVQKVVGRLSTVLCDTFMKCKLDSEFVQLFQSTDTEAAWISPVTNDSTHVTGRSVDSTNKAFIDFMLSTLNAVERNGLQATEPDRARGSTGTCIVDQKHDPNAPRHNANTQTPNFIKSILLNVLSDTNEHLSQSNKLSGLEVKQIHPTYEVSIGKLNACKTQWDPYDNSYNTKVVSIDRLTYNYIVAPRIIEVNSSALPPPTPRSLLHSSRESDIFEEPMTPQPLPTKSQEDLDELNRANHSPPAGILGYSPSDKLFRHTPEKNSVEFNDIVSPDQTTMGLKDCQVQIRAICRLQSNEITTDPLTVENVETMKALNHLSPPVILLHLNIDIRTPSEVYRISDIRLDPPEVVQRSLRIKVEDRETKQDGVRENGGLAASIILGPSAILKDHTVPSVPESTSLTSSKLERDGIQPKSVMSRVASHQRSFNRKVSEKAQSLKRVQERLACVPKKSSTEVSSADAPMASTTPSRLERVNKQKDKVQNKLTNIMRHVTPSNVFKKAHHDQVGEGPEPQIEQVAIISSEPGSDRFSKQRKQTTKDMRINQDEKRNSRQKNSKTLPPSTPGLGVNRGGLSMDAARRDLNTMYAEMPPAQLGMAKNADVEMNVPSPNTMENISPEGVSNDADINIPDCWCRQLSELYNIEVKVENTTTVQDLAEEEPGQYADLLEGKIKSDTDAVCETHPKPTKPVNGVVVNEYNNIYKEPERRSTGGVLPPKVHEVQPDKNTMTDEAIEQSGRKSSRVECESFQPRYVASPAVEENTKTSVVSRKDSNVLLPDTTEKETINHTILGSPIQSLYYSQPITMKSSNVDFPSAVTMDSIEHQSSQETLDRDQLKLTTNRIDTDRTSDGFHRCSKTKLGEDSKKENETYEEWGQQAIEEHKTTSHVLHNEAIDQNESPPQRRPNELVKSENAINVDTVTKNVDTNSKVSRVSPTEMVSLNQVRVTPDISKCEARGQIIHPAATKSRESPESDSLTRLNAVKQSRAAKALNESCIPPEIPSSDVPKKHSVERTGSQSPGLLNRASQLNCVTRSSREPEKVSKGSTKDIGQSINETPNEHLIDQTAMQLPTPISKSSQQIDVDRLNVQMQKETDKKFTGSPVSIIKAPSDMLNKDSIEKTSLHSPRRTSFTFQLGCIEMSPNADEDSKRSNVQQEIEYLKPESATRPNQDTQQDDDNTSIARNTLTSDHPRDVLNPNTTEQHGVKSPRLASISSHRSGLLKSNIDITKEDNKVSRGSQLSTGQPPSSILNTDNFDQFVCQSPMPESVPPQLGGVARLDFGMQMDDGQSATRIHGITEHCPPKRISATSQQSSPTRPTVGIRKDDSSSRRSNISPLMPLADVLLGELIKTTSARSSRQCSGSAQLDDIVRLHVNKLKDDKASIGSHLSIDRPQSNMVNAENDHPYARQSRESSQLNRSEIGILEAAEKDLQGIHVPVENFSLIVPNQEITEPSKSRSLKRSSGYSQQGNIARLDKDLQKKDGNACKGSNIHTLQPPVDLITKEGTANTGSYSPRREINSLQPDEVVGLNTILEKEGKKAFNENKIPTLQPSIDVLNKDNITIRSSESPNQASRPGQPRSDPNLSTHTQREDKIAFHGSDMPTLQSSTGVLNKEELDQTGSQPSGRPNNPAKPDGMIELTANIQKEDGKVSRGSQFSTDQPQSSILKTETIKQGLCQSPRQGSGSSQLGSVTTLYADVQRKGEQDPTGIRGSTGYCPLDTSNQVGVTTSGSHSPKRISLSSHQSGVTRPDMDRVKEADNVSKGGNIPLTGVVNKDVTEQTGSKSSRRESGPSHPDIVMEQTKNVHNEEYGLAKESDIHTSFHPVDLLSNAASEETENPSPGKVSGSFQPASDNRLQLDAQEEEEKPPKGNRLSTGQPQSDILNKEAICQLEKQENGFKLSIGIQEDIGKVSEKNRIPTDTHQQDIQSQVSIQKETGLGSMPNRVPFRESVDSPDRQTQLTNQKHETDVRTADPLQQRASKSSQLGSGTKLNLLSEKKSDKVYKKYQPSPETHEVSLKYQEPTAIVENISFQHSDYRPSIRACVPDTCPVLCVGLQNEAETGSKGSHWSHLAYEYTTDEIVLSKVVNKEQTFDDAFQPQCQEKVSPPTCSVARSEDNIENKSKLPTDSLCASKELALSDVSPKDVIHQISRSSNPKSVTRVKLDVQEESKKAPVQSSIPPRRISGSSQPKSITIVNVEVQEESEKAPVQSSLSPRRISGSSQPDNVTRVNVDVQEESEKAPVQSSLPPRRISRSSQPESITKVNVDVQKEYEKAPVQSSLPPRRISGSSQPESITRVNVDVQEESEKAPVQSSLPPRRISESFHPDSVTRVNMDVQEESEKAPVRSSLPPRRISGSSQPESITRVNVDVQEESEKAPAQISLPPRRISESSQPDNVTRVNVDVQKESEKAPVQSSLPPRRINGSSQPESVTRVNVDVQKEYEKAPVQSSLPPRRISGSSQPESVTRVNMDVQKEYEKAPVQSSLPHRRISGSSQPESITRVNVDVQKEYEKAPVQSSLPPGRISESSHPDSVTRVSVDVQKESEKAPVQSSLPPRRINGSSQPESVTRVNVDVQKEYEKAPVQSSLPPRRISGSSHPDSVTRVSVEVQKESEKAPVQSSLTPRHISGSSHPDSVTRVSVDVQEESEKAPVQSSLPHGRISELSHPDSVIRVSVDVQKESEKAPVQSPLQQGRISESSQPESLIRLNVNVQKGATETSKQSYVSSKKLVNIQKEQMSLDTHKDKPITQTSVQIDEPYRPENVTHVDLRMQNETDTLNAGSKRIPEARDVQPEYEYHTNTVKSDVLQKMRHQSPKASISACYPGTCPILSSNMQNEPEQYLEGMQSSLGPINVVTNGIDSPDFSQKHDVQPRTQRIVSDKPVSKVILDTDMQCDAARDSKGSQPSQGITEAASSALGSPQLVNNETVSRTGGLSPQRGSRSSQQGSVTRLHVPVPTANHEGSTRSLRLQEEGQVGKEVFNQTDNKPSKTTTATCEREINYECLPFSEFRSNASLDEPIGVEYQPYLKTCDLQSREGSTRTEKALTVDQDSPPHYDNIPDENTFSLQKDDALRCKEKPLQDDVKSIYSIALTNPHKIKHHFSTLLTADTESVATTQPPSVHDHKPSNTDDHQGHEPMESSDNKRAIMTSSDLVQPGVINEAVENVLLIQSSQGSALNQRVLDTLEDRTLLADRIPMDGESELMRTDETHASTLVLTQAASVAAYNLRKSQKLDSFEPMKLPLSESDVSKTLCTENAVHSIQYNDHPDNCALSVIDALKGHPQCPLVDEASSHVSSKTTPKGVDLEDKVPNGRHFLSVRDSYHSEDKIEKHTRANDSQTNRSISSRLSDTLPVRRPSVDKTLSIQTHIPLNSGGRTSTGSGHASQIKHKPRISSSASPKPLKPTNGHVAQLLGEHQADQAEQPYVMDSKGKQRQRKPREQRYSDSNRGEHVRMHLADGNIQDGTNSMKNGLQMDPYDDYSSKIKLHGTLEQENSKRRLLTVGEDSQDIRTGHTTLSKLEIQDSGMKLHGTINKLPGLENLSNVKHEDHRISQKTVKELIALQSHLINLVKQADSAIIAKLGQEIEEGSMACVIQWLSGGHKLLSPESSASKLGCLLLTISPVNNNLDEVKMVITSSAIDICTDNSKNVDEYGNPITLTRSEQDDLSDNTTMTPKANIVLKGKQPLSQEASLTFDSSVSSDGTGVLESSADAVTSESTPSTTQHSSQDPESEGDGMTEELIDWIMQYRRCSHSEQRHNPKDPRTRSHSYKGHKAERKVTFPKHVRHHSYHYQMAQSPLDRGISAHRRQRKAVLIQSSQPSAKQTNLRMPPTANNATRLLELSKNLKDISVHMVYRDIKRLLDKRLLTRYLQMRSAQQ